MRDKFLLRDDIIYLNHGSFGATPRYIFDKYIELQRELESEPCEFLLRRGSGLLKEARLLLSGFLNCDASDIVAVHNATTAVNIVARSIELGPGDEVLTTNHEYGACDRVFRYLSRKEGFNYRRVEIKTPLPGSAEFVDTVSSAFTERTRLLFLSHITSPTGLVFPVEEVIQLARERGILTLIDGAHVPGHIELDLRALKPDFYTGNLYKWLLTPKGSAFLYADKGVQDLLEPLVVSWGYEPEEPGESYFQDLFEWQGTDDICPFLSVKAALEFRNEHNLPELQKECRRVILALAERIRSELGFSLLFTDESQLGQMLAFELPAGSDPKAIQDELFYHDKIEIPARLWEGCPVMRVSYHVYNSPEDLDKLIEALKRVGRG
ncbi:MAG: aminotransferase class V-fold PLP-dependent enzyme [Candidatus Dadabacteria bacterium]|nr:MAG: aminotransferase class V-fold PLP-dependent enzyme [Candidatus Dadabacteria bacterium]